MDLQFTCKAFHELTLNELYAILVLRQEVFVVEQNCPYLDSDDKDQESWHLMGHDKEGHLLAYSRLLPRGLSYQEFCSIGRVVTAPSIRKSGAGRKLMDQTMERLSVLFAGTDIKISAQLYLQKFYESYGFTCVGESYLEDDIPHIAMIRRVTDT